jgi:DNA-binding CsgD family transcriptional regulator
MRELLLGYLLGALDADEQAAIERRLTEDPKLRDELELLRKHLQLLDCCRIEYEPPGDLVARTCAQLDSLNKTDPPNRAKPDAKATPAPRPYESCSHHTTFSMLEMLLTAGVCAAMAILFFPAILESRDQALVTRWISTLVMAAACVCTLQACERKVFDRVVRGKLNKQIGAELRCTERTVKWHRHNLMQKLGAGSLAELVSMAERLGLLGIPGSTDLAAE